MAEPGAVARPSAQAGGWTVLTVILSSAEYLERKGVGRARLDAEYLLGHVLDLERLQLYLQYDRPLKEHEIADLRPLLRRRAGREPLQYILGRQPFRTLDLIVGPAVLIPRPETEGLVEEVLRWSAEVHDRGLTALDLGTGSGAIGLSLAAEGPFDLVVATDVSEEALTLAERNRSECGLDDRVELRAGAYFDPVAVGERFDVVVSNPPYVAEIELSELEPEVREWEPKAALIGGADGLEALRRIAESAAEYVRAGGLLALEVGWGQAHAVREWLEASGDYDDVEIRKDLAGKDRVVLARRAHSA